MSVRQATIRVGTRGSALARRQTDLVISALQAHHPGVDFSVEVIRTEGDTDPVRELTQFEGQGVFVHALEQALLDGQIDVAVHSSKDMPSRLTAGLELVFPSREDPRDALVTRDGVTLVRLPAGARIGTGSPRRRALLRYLRPDIEVVPIRGNVDTRLRRAHQRDIEGVVLAAAGLRRLARIDEATELLPPDQFIPAGGQGILGIEVRSDDADVHRLVAPLDDPLTRAAAEAERQVALTVGAGCQTPIGAYAAVEGEELTVHAFLALDDERTVWARQTGPIAGARQLGQAVGEQLLAGGTAAPGGRGRTGGMR